jgi:hypothetical protein
MSALEFQDTVPGEGAGVWGQWYDGLGNPVGPAVMTCEVSYFDHEGNVQGFSVDTSHPTRARTYFAKPSTTMSALDGSDSADSLPTVGDVVWFWLGMRIRTITWLFVFAIMGGAAIGWGSLAWVVVRRWLA